MAWHGSGVMAAWQALARLLAPGYLFCCTAHCAHALISLPRTACKSENGNKRKCGRQHNRARINATRYARRGYIRSPLENNSSGINSAL